MRRHEFLDAQLSADITRHAIDAYPYEALGVITPEGYLRCENKSPEPERHGVYDSEVMDALVIENRLLAIVHSHPNGPNAPSKTDMELQIQLDLPAVLVCTNGDGCMPLTVWGDMFEPDPLLKRGFQSGVTDCYELCRDWYWFEEGRRPPPAARGWAWWRTGENMVDTMFRQFGFVRVFDEEPQRGWAALCTFGKSLVPNHGLIYQGDGKVLNHSSSGAAYDPSRLSKEEPLARWQPYITRWMKPDEDRQAIWQTS